MPRFDSRLGCSTISFRHQPLPEALATIAGLGFTEIDLGALPGVCDHVPYVLDADRRRGRRAHRRSRPGCRSARSTATSVTSTSRSTSGHAGRRRATSTCSSPSPSPPAPARWCCPAARSTTRRSRRWTPTSTASPTNSRRQPTSPPRAASSCGPNRCTFTGCAGTSNAHSCSPIVFPTRRCIVMDFSHVVASGGDPVEFVGRFGDAHRTRPHPRRRPGQHQPLGRPRRRRLRRRTQGLATPDYAGHFSLELETRDVTHDQRPAATAAPAA